jgi:hypothetical protein
MFVSAPHQTHRVIPAHAGIQYPAPPTIALEPASRRVLDSRLRGNDTVYFADLFA